MNKVLCILTILFGITQHGYCIGTFISEMRCDNRLGSPYIDSEEPVLSWIISSDGRNKKQSAYQVLVATSAELLERDIGDLWNSGKVITDQSIQVPYQGELLSSRQHCYWKVRVWDELGNESPWSNNAEWTMALLYPDDWKAYWIGHPVDSNKDAAPLFRKEFSINRKIKEATIYVSGVGYYELRINGEKIGDHVLDPAQTDYEKRVLYTIYDVSDNLQVGGNAMAIMLGNGWYKQSLVWGGLSYGEPRTILQLEILYMDGDRETIVSDNTWKAGAGPVTFNNVYAGEVYDARLEREGWDHPEFNDFEWPYALVCNPPGGILELQKLPAIKRIEIIKPVSVSNPKPGVYVYNLGQNIAGWARLKVNGSAGSRIQMKFAENLDNEGMIDPASTGVKATGVVQTNTYYCKGSGEEVYEPRFTYHGFQYVEVTGFPGIPGIDNIEGVVVHSAVEPGGTFKCSDPMLNRIYQTAIWTIRGNMHGLLTDCPHRERTGWTGDAHLAAETAIYNMNMAAFFTKYVRDIETSLIQGLPSATAPGLRIRNVGNPDWGAAVVILPWYIYKYYGDTRILAEQYANMKRFIKYLNTLEEGGIINRGFGDWYDPPAEGADAISLPMPKNTPVKITSTAYYFKGATIMARIAEILNKPEDKEDYLLLAERTREAFNREFFKGGNSYGSQTANAMALRFGLVKEQDRSPVVESLIKDIIEEHNGHFSTGVHGAKHLYSVLSDENHGDIALRILKNTTYPSIGYLFSLGATTMWENWSLTPNHRGVPRSRNHPMNTGFATWFSQSLGGIKTDETEPAFKKIILKPDFLDSLTSVHATYNSPYGLIVSDWKREENLIRYSIKVPFNSVAEVYLPLTTRKKTLESRTTAGKAEGVKLLRKEDNFSIYLVGSGEYSFQIYK